MQVIHTCWDFVFHIVADLSDASYTCWDFVLRIVAELSDASYNYKMMLTKNELEKLHEITF